MTTPQRLSIVDMAKGVEMFQNFRIPIWALVENMSYFECEHGSRYYPFGRGTPAQALALATGAGAALEVPEFKVPLQQSVSESAEGVAKKVHRPRQLRSPVPVLPPF